LVAKLSLDDLRACVLGGAILGGGGGGSRQLGMELGTMALEAGSVELLSPNEVSNDLILITCALVGAPAANSACTRPAHFLRAVELLLANLGLSRDEVGLITNENGGAATINGWYQAAKLELPLVDIPCNGRAHPMAIMGAMGLENREGYLSRQAVAGGDDQAGRYLELTLSARLDLASRAVRHLAQEAGGLAAVARNPVDAGYAKEYGAPGAIAQAREIGRAWYSQDYPRQRIEAAMAVVGGQIVAEGILQAVDLETRGGFDVGKAMIDNAPATVPTVGPPGRPQGYPMEIPFWNEYVRVTAGAERLGAFPDLIGIFGPDGFPVSSAELAAHRGRQVHITVAPSECLLLGEGVRSGRYLRDVEKAVGVSLR